MISVFFLRCLTFECVFLQYRLIRRIFLAIHRSVGPRFHVLPSPRAHLLCKNIQLRQSLGLCECEEMGLKLSAHSGFRKPNYTYSGCKDEETSCIPAPANDETAIAPTATSTAISPTIVGIARTAVTIATIQKATSPKMNLGSFQGKKTFAKSFAKAE
jgi:hypothetical protein